MYKYSRVFSACRALIKAVNTLTKSPTPARQCRVQLSSTLGTEVVLTGHMGCKGGGPRGARQLKDCPRCRRGGVLLLLNVLLLLLLLLGLIEKGQGGGGGGGGGGVEEEKQGKEKEE